MIISIISFYLDGFISNLLMTSNIYYPLCSILSLVVIYPSFSKKDNRKYYFLSFILGLFYDIVYMNTLFIHSVIFVFLAFLIKSIYGLVTYNYLSLLVVSLFVIIVYRLLMFLIILTSYNTLNISIFFQSIYSSLIINFIYITVCYLFIRKKQYKK